MAHHESRWYSGGGLARGLAYLGVLLAAGGVVTRAAAAGGPWSFYGLTSLGTLPGYSSSAPVAINEAGEVLCQARGTHLPVRSFLWSGGSRIDLGTPAGDTTLAYDLDDHGHVVGAGASEAGVLTPLLWDAGQAQALPLLPGYPAGEARAIGNDGRIAGDLIDPQGGHHACVWEGGEAALLPALPGRPFSHAQGINNHGQVVGATFAVYDPPVPGHAGQGRAALWRDGEVLDLGVAPGYSASEANAVNDAGDVVGQSLESPGYREGFRWRAGAFRRIRTLNSTITAINTPGMVVGTATDYLGHGSYRSMGWWWNSDDAGLPFTNQFAGEGSSFLDTANALNDAGQVAGVSYGGAVLLTPVAADVQLSLTASTLSPQVGVPFTLTLVVRNLGPDPAYRPEYTAYAPPGLEFLSVSATEGNPWVYGGGAGGYLSALPPQASVTLTITAIAHAAGGLEVRAERRVANDVSTNGYRASLTFSVAGTPLPDLVPRWSWLQVRRDAGRPRIEQSVSGTLFVTNWGTSLARRPRVRFYLVLPGELLQQKRLLQTTRMASIEPGDLDYISLHARLPLDLGGPRGRVLAVVDEPDQIAESIETNNSALSADLSEEKR
jgi:uncharacterized repeat protein (TIGR01451 family)